MTAEQSASSPETENKIIRGLRQALDGEVTIRASSPVEGEVVDALKDMILLAEVASAMITDRDLFRRTERRIAKAREALTTRSVAVSSEAVDCILDCIDRVADGSLTSECASVEVRDLLNQARKPEGAE